MKIKFITNIGDNDARRHNIPAGAIDGAVMDVEESVAKVCVGRGWAVSLGGAPVAPAAATTPAKKTPAKKTSSKKSGKDKDDDEPTDPNDPPPTDPGGGDNLPD